MIQQIWIDDANREIMKGSIERRGGQNKIHDGLTKYQRYERKHPYRSHGIGDKPEVKKRILKKFRWLDKKASEITISDFMPIKIVRTGFKHTELSKRNMSLSKIGYTHKPESIEKMRNKVVSDHTRALIKEARRHQKFPKAFSKPERFAESILRTNGVNCTMQKMEILGRPDIFIEPNICIFIDGDYVHGNPAKHKQNDKVCFGRIAKDIWEKDLRITNQIISDGYKVIRIWTSEFYKNRKVYPEKIISLAEYLKRELKEKISDESSDIRGW
jgi:G:T-mismatch repair DNA endonuclease (very short patch repair protein)